MRCSMLGCVLKSSINLSLVLRCIGSARSAASSSRLPVTTQPSAAIPATSSDFLITKACCDGLDYR